MKKAIILIVLFTMIYLPVNARQSIIPSPKLNGYFTVKYGRQVLRPIIWQAEEDGQNYLFTTGLARISEQNTEYCGDMPVPECKIAKATKVALNDAEAKLEKIYPGRKFFEKFDIGESNIDNEFVYVIGKVPSPKLPVAGLPKWLKVEGKVAFLLEGDEEYFSLATVEPEPNKRLSKAIKLAKEISKLQLKNFLQLKKVHGWCVEEETYSDEEDAKTVFVFGSITKKD